VNRAVKHITLRAHERALPTTVVSLFRLRLLTVPSTSHTCLTELPGDVNDAKDCSQHPLTVGGGGPYNLSDRQSTEDAARAPQTRPPACAARSQIHTAAQSFVKARPSQSGGTRRMQSGRTAPQHSSAQRRPSNLAPRARPFFPTVCTGSPAPDG